MATLNPLSSAAANVGMQQLLTFDNGVQLVQAANGVMTRGNNYANTLTGLLGSAPALHTQFPAGNHHFTIGSGVKGGKFYGNFPLLVPGGSDDTGTRGVLLPATAVDQYGATLAQWFGVPQSSLPTVFPNIANFGTSPLGFLS